MNMGIQRGTRYEIECWRGGRLIWSDRFTNLVVTAGLNDSLDKHFKGAAYTAAWYVGLTGSAPVFAAGDTLAAHAGWTEDTNYAEATRQALVLGAVAAGSVDNSASKAQFTINAATTVGGAFLATSDVKGGAAGVLYGGGAFSGGDRAVLADDTVLITIILTAAAV